MVRSLLVTIGYLIGCAVACGVACGCSLDHGTPSPAIPNPGDAFVIDATSDGAHDGAIVDGSSDGGADTVVPEAPPPIEDSAIDDFGTRPPPGNHAESSIGPAGGSVVGGAGTPLSGVMLVVPPGALSTTMIIALDLDGAPSPLPAGATIDSPYVRVGPEATTFSIPARLTLPFLPTSVASPQLVMMAHAGVSWGALLDPSGDASAKTLTASMRRASGAAAMLVSIVDPPKPSSVVGSGSVTFVEGSGFGLAPAWRLPGDSGVSFTSSVEVAGATATPLAWSDTEITIATSADAGTITVRTPGGSASLP